MLFIVAVVATIMRDLLPFLGRQDLSSSFGLHHQSAWALHGFGSNSGYNDVMSPGKSAVYRRGKVSLPRVAAGVAATVTLLCHHLHFAKF